MRVDIADESGARCQALFEHLLAEDPSCGNTASSALRTFQRRVNQRRGLFNTTIALFENGHPLHLFRVPRKYSTAAVARPDATPSSGRKAVHTPDESRC